MRNVTRILAFLAVSLPLYSPSSLAQLLMPPQPLLVTTKILSQKYCRGYEGTFDIRLKLRLHFLNRTDRKLIVDKTIGTAWDGVVVAANTEKLFAGVYEYNPTIDRISSDEEKAGPNSKFPGQNFYILMPGQSFEMDYERSIIQLLALERRLDPGSHVLQVQMASWSYLPSSSKFKERWQRYGDLLDQVVVTVPLPFEVPSKPNIVDCQ